MFCGSSSAFKNILFHPIQFLLGPYLPDPEFGDDGVSRGIPKFKETKGPLRVAMESGTTILLDEFDLADPATTSMLFPLLEVCMRAWFKYSSGKMPINVLLL
jgi:hypothetical protein